MNPVSTQLILKENSEKFTGFGKAKAFIETSKGRNITIRKSICLQNEVRCHEKTGTKN